MNKLFKLYRVLVVIEAALLLGLIEFYLENTLSEMPVSIYWRVAAIMVMMGGLFSFFFFAVEGITKKFIANITSKSYKHTVRLAIHFFILTCFYALYLFFYFNKSVI